jgi:hypothetical protein
VRHQVLNARVVLDLDTTVADSHLPGDLLQTTILER